MQTKWHKLEINELCDIEKVPQKAGCYVIYLQEKLCYVGSSVKSMQSRIKQHIKRTIKQHLPIKKMYTTKELETLFFDNNLARSSGLNVDDGKIAVKYKISRKIGEELMREYRLLNKLNPICNGRTGTINVKEEVFGWHYINPRQ